MKKLIKIVKDAFFSVRVLEDDTPTSEYVIYQAINTYDGEYLQEVTDKVEYERLTEEFKDVISMKLGNSG